MSVVSQASSLEDTFDRSLKSIVLLMSKKWLSLKYGFAIVFHCVIGSYLGQSIYKVQFCSFCMLLKQIGM